MEDIFAIFLFSWDSHVQQTPLIIYFSLYLLWIKQIEEFLNKFGGDVELELLDLDRLVYDELEEKFVNTLEVRPSGVHLLLLIDASFGKVKIAFPDAG